MQYQDWEKSNYEVYSSLQHGQNDELMHFGVKGMSWKKGAEYLRNGGKLVNGVVVYAGNQLQKGASALDKATGGRAGRAATVAKGKTALKAALKATGKAIDKGVYRTGKAMAKAVNSKALAKTAAKVKAKISTNKYGKKVADMADAVAKKVNSKGAKQFRKDFMYKHNNTYRKSVDNANATKAAAKAAAEEKARVAKEEEQRKADNAKRAQTFETQKKYIEKAYGRGQFSDATIQKGIKYATDGKGNVDGQKLNAFLKAQDHDGTEAQKVAGQNAANKAKGDVAARNAVADSYMKSDSFKQYMSNNGIVSVGNDVKDLVIKNMDDKGNVNKATLYSDLAEYKKKKNINTGGYAY